MHSERQRDPGRRIDPHPAESGAATGPWADLRLDILNDRRDESIVAVVECVLVELTHEDVGAEYRSSNAWGATIDQYVAAEATGQQFIKRRYDERLGWDETQITREAVRDKLVWQLSRSGSLATNRSHAEPATNPDTFVVKPTQQLRTDSGYEEC
jgi:hypothetical protein